MNKMETDKGETLRIRCSKKTLKDFKSLVIDSDFRNYEDCIAALMRLATANPLLFERFKDKVRWG
jgi:hypothetical protein